MTRTTFMLSVPLILAVSQLAGCSKQADAERPAAAEASGAETPEAPAHGARTASAVLQTAPGVALSGKAEFSELPSGVRARVELANAKPGKHGIHIHQKGDCSDIPGKSMGEHFAPDAKEHGLLESPVRHLGDLGNIEVDADGTGAIDVEVPAAKLDDGSHSYVGKALVIHEKEDVGTGPSGDSGSPIACAVIQAR
jgi:superoxide dismutase, Cu-Zn family